MSATPSIFELVLVRPVLTEAGEHPSLVHLWWRAPRQGQRLVQVYVDGELVEVSRHVQQRELWLHCDRRRARVIELLAVPVDDAAEFWRPRPDLMDGASPAFTSAACAAVVRDAALPVDAQMVVEVDGLAADRAALWPDEEPRGGFGALFGLGRFGRDDAAGPGLGEGELGLGPLGSDGTAFHWRRDDLAAGTHQVRLTAADPAGRPVARALTLPPVCIDAPPAPAQDLTVTEDFTIAWRA